MEARLPACLPINSNQHVSEHSPLRMMQPIWAQHVELINQIPLGASLCDSSRPVRKRSRVLWNTRTNDLSLFWTRKMCWLNLEFHFQNKNYWFFLGLFWLFHYSWWLRQTFSWLQWLFDLIEISFSVEILLFILHNLREPKLWFHGWHLFAAARSLWFLFAQAFFVLELFRLNQYLKTNAGDTIPFLFSRTNHSVVITCLCWKTFPASLTSRFLWTCLRQSLRDCRPITQVAALREKVSKNTNQAKWQPIWIFHSISVPKNRTNFVIPGSECLFSDRVLPEKA